MKMPKTYYSTRSTSAAPPRDSANMSACHSGSGANHHLSTPSRAISHGSPTMATTQSHQYQNIETSENPHSLSVSGDQHFTAAPSYPYPSSPPRTTKTVRWKYDLTSSIVIPNKEQMRELERRYQPAEQLPRSRHSRRRSHTPPPLVVEEPPRFNKGQGRMRDARFDPQAPVESMLDRNGDPYWH